MTPREKLKRLVPGIICPVIVSYGMCASLLESYLLPVTPVYTLLCVLTITLVTALLSYNLRVGAIAPALIAAAALYIWKNAEEYMERIIIINNTLYDARMFLVGADLPEGYDIRIVCIIICLLVCVPTALFLSRMRGGLPFLLITASVFITQWLLGHTFIIPYMCLSICGLIPVFAYEAARHNGKRDKSLRPPSAALALFMLLPAVIIAMLSNFVLPDNTSGFRSPFVVGTLNGINNALAPLTGFGRIVSDYSIGSMGFNSNEARLGGPAFLRDSEVLRITGDKPLLLRGSVYNIYTGSSWKKELTEEPVELANVGPEEELDRMFDELSRYEGSRPSFLQSPVYEQLKFTVTTLGPVGRTIFSTGLIFGIYPQDGKILRIDKMGGIFSDEPLTINESYTAYVYNLKFNSPEFKEIMLNFGHRRTPGLTQNDSDYFALPESLPESVGELAAALTADEPSDYAGALAIENYLKDNFTYTLRPSYPDRETDFVQHFFETGEGYCVYFATAMTVLARSAGLPARYVEGFSLGNVEANEDGDYIVRARNAHAWTEIWFDNVGWVVFDATPADELTGTGGIPEPEPEIESEPEQEPEAPEETPAETPEEEAAEPETEETEGTPFSRFPVLPAVLIIIVLLTGSVILLRKYLRMRKYDSACAASRMPNVRLRAEYYWRDTLKTLSRMGVKPVPGQTPREFAAAADMPGIDGAVEIMERLIYGGVEPDSEQLSRLVRLARELDMQRRAARPDILRRH